MWAGMEVPSRSRGSWNLPFRTRNVASCVLFFRSNWTEHSYNVKSSYYLFLNGHRQLPAMHWRENSIVPLLSCTERLVSMVLSSVTPLDYAHLHNCPPQAKQGKNLHVSSVPCMWQHIRVYLDYCHKSVVGATLRIFYPREKLLLTLYKFCFLSHHYHNLSWE